jgi:hypothetical protein
VCALARLTFWKWFLGTAVKQRKLPHRPELKIVSVASGAKLPARLTSSASGFISALKLRAVWVWLTKQNLYAFIFIHVGSNIWRRQQCLLFFEFGETGVLPKMVAISSYG